ncbi:uncharacterized protein LOC117330673 isoform X2 [Pecten maximus]|nr:uncharacterized protein LOC117330673 isoform X2 [Pecten maximus]XP_033745003.1 uncharacterized protein LOC117330673 isoform X2 [Pecten maximus]XP_033745004.1 uncharacterized protein LOC117330673 isoform X2 [Pecten maximus]
MGKKNRPVSNGTHGNKEHPKPPSPSRTKNKKSTNGVPQYLLRVGVMAAVAAVVTYLVIMYVPMSYLTSLIPEDLTRSKTPPLTSESRPSPQSKSSSKSSSQSKQGSESSQSKSSSQSRQSPESSSQSKSSSSSSSSKSSTSSSSKNSAQNSSDKSKPISTGGWQLASDKTNQQFDSSLCTMDRLSVRDLTSEQFEKVYRYKKPLIVTFPNGAKDWTQPDRWSVKNLKREYGKWSVLYGNSLEIVRRGGNGHMQTSFTEYVDRLMKDRDAMGDPFYIFDRSFYNDSTLPKTLKPPKYFEIKDGIDDSIFFMGASSSGVSFHKHADAWNGVIFGRKRWFLYDIHQTPPGGVYPGFTQGEWYKKLYPHLDDAHKPQECIQEAGEILYLPEGTYHGTINLGDTVAVGIQKKRAKTKEERLFYEELAVSNELGGLSQSDERKKKLESRKIQIYTKLQQLLPGNAEVKMKQGQMYFDLQRLRDGLENTQKAIDLDPNFVIAHLNKGKILTQLKKNKEAEAAYNKALALNPDLWDIHAAMGDFFMNNGRPAEAVPHFKRGTELQPDMMPFWLYLQQAQQQAGDKEAALNTAQILNELRLKNMKTEPLQPVKKSG